MRSYFVPVVLFIFLANFSCNNPKDVDQKIDYKFFNLQQQGWKSKRITQFATDINYSATEVPLYYYLLNNIGDDYAKIDSIFKRNAYERIIEVEFQHSKETDLFEEKYTQKSYEDAVKYMAFAIEKDFTVVTSSNDTIACSGVNFERNFKVAPFKRILLYFNNINPDDTIKLIYQDQLFGNGTFKFNFSEVPLKL